MNHDLDRLLSPASVAVVGATESAGKPGRRVTESLLRSGVKVFPVHPTRELVLGRKAFPGLRELPETPDLVVVAVAAATAVEAAAAAVAIRVPYVIVLAGGFGESGEEGRRLERRLGEIVTGSGTRLLGPNTLGIQVPGGVDTIFVEHSREGLTPAIPAAAIPAAATPTGVAVISQSGSVAVEALAAAAGHGFPLRCFVGLGNAIDLGTTEFLDHFAGDPGTSCICVYLEHLGEGRLLLEAARRAAARKPVFFLKAGRTKAGAAAVASHTGRLAGSDRVVDGALRQHGIQRAADDEALTDAARVVSYARPAHGNRVAVITPAGGYGVMCVDAIKAPLELASLSSRTEERLREICLPFAAVHNPVDLTAGVDTDAFADAVNAVIADPQVDILIVLAFFAPDGIGDDLVDRIAASARASDKSLLVFCRFGARTDEYCRAFTDRGLAAFDSLSRTVCAARALVERSRIVGAVARSTSATPAATPSVAVGAQWVSRFDGQRPPNEADVKSLLSRHGLMVPVSQLVPAGEPPRAPDFDGPYAVKVVSASILHKTDAGGLRLNVEKGRLPRVMAELRERFPDESILVEQMVGDVTVEMIAGATRDPDLGPALMVGAGGTFTELSGDVSFRLIPCGREEIETMLGELRLAPLLAGYRGISVDRDGLVDWLVSFASLIAEVADAIEECDINPLAFAAGRWVALDAKMVLRFNRAR